MRVFVGFGYNPRDAWIEDSVFPILRDLGFAVVDGKDMHGETLQPGVEQRIQQSDAVVGFLTLRQGQGNADFTSHIWVRDELLYARGLGKPIVPIKEEGVNVPDGLLGDRQYITLARGDRLGCVKELVGALGRRNIRRIKLEPEQDDLRRNLKSWRLAPNFKIRYRTQDENGIESRFRDGRLELVDHSFYLNVHGVSRKSLLEVEGEHDGAVRFNSGWVSADAVLVKI
jgi:hypothetical protein